MQKINWGIIGCGDVTEIKSGPAFNKVSNAALVAVMRRTAVKAADYAQRHNVPRWYDNADKLINDAEVNAIYIATPPSSHKEYALAAINAGKPVYVEKPMSLNYTDAQNIAAAAKEKNIKLSVAHYRREQPRFKKIKQLIINKAIGEILYARITLNKPPLTANELNNPMIAWRVNPAIAGGGLFNDLAPHQLDLMYYFFGEVKKVNGIATNQGAAYNADDMVAGNILFKNGVAFSGAWCFNAYEETDHCEITGTKGKINFKVFSTHSFIVETNEGRVVHDFDELPHVQQPMIAAVVNYFLNDGHNPCTGEEGAEVMRLMQEFVGTKSGE